MVEFADMDVQDYVQSRSVVSFFGTRRAGHCFSFCSDGILP